MEPLGSLYIALGVFGLGVTVVDLFGLLGHHDSAGHHDLSAAHDSPATAHEALVSHEGLAAHDHHGNTEHGSILGPGDLRARAIGRLVSGLRLVVSFCLGAGLTGFVALLSHIAAGTSLIWSVAGGVLIAAITRLVRRVARRELDSSLRPADFIMSEAEITIGVEPGRLGKARVRRYGFESDIYVRCTDRNRALAAGTHVRIVDLDDECYYVDPL